MSEFKAPAVKVGDKVNWWSEGRVTSEPTVGFVVAQNLYNVEIVLINQTSQFFWDKHSEVLHRDDPRLQASPDQRRHGCWDLHQDQKMLNQLGQQMDQIATRLQLIEEQVAKKSK